MFGKDSSPVRWDGPPTSRTDRLGRVKGTRGKGLGVKKGLRAGKFENWRRRPVQPVSAMMGGAEIELSALVGRGVARADLAGAGGETSKSEST